MEEVTALAVIGIPLLWALVPFPLFIWLTLGVGGIYSGLVIGGYLIIWLVALVTQHRARRSASL